MEKGDVWNFQKYEKVTDCDVYLTSFKSVAKEKLAGKTMIKEMGVSLLTGLCLIRNTYHQKSQYIYLNTQENQNHYMEGTEGLKKRLLCHT